MRKSLKKRFTGRWERLRLHLKHLSNSAMPFLLLKLI